MALYSDLTDQEKQDYEAFENWARGMVSSLGQIMRTAPEMVNFYTDRIVPINAQLDDLEGAPKTSGLAGSRPLTHEQLINISNFIGGINTDIQTNLDLLQEAAGINV